MMMVINILAAKHIVRSPSMFVFSHSLGLTTSKSGIFNSVLPLIQQRSNNFWFRSFTSSSEEDHDNNSKTEEKEWIRRITEVVTESQCFYDHKVYALVHFGTEGLSMEKEKLSYRERWATYRLVYKIEDVARRLIDDNVDKICQVFYLVDRRDIWALYVLLEKANYDECWMSLLKSSKQPLADKLRDKLKETGISPVTFSSCMKKVYRQLLHKCDLFDFWSIEVVEYEPNDIINVLNNLPIDETDFECIKLLFNLEESEKWQIKDYFKKSVIPK